MTVANLGPCREWRGLINGNGYGVFRAAKRVDRECSGAERRWPVLVHRRVMERFIGRPLRRDELVMHLCDNRRCFRLAHLRVGSNADNLSDMVAKGRSSRGEQRWSARLTEDDVRAIRASDEPLGVLAQRYGVSKQQLSKIRLRQRWRHVA